MDDYYALLNLNRSADEDSIRSAINREVRVWAQRTNAPELEKRQVAVRKMKILAEAEATLLDDTRRCRYDRTLATQPIRRETGTESAESEVHVAVQSLVEKANALVRSGNYPAAISQLKKAATLDPGNLAVQAMLTQLKQQWGQILIKQNY